MSSRSWPWILARIAATLLLGAVAWVVLAYLSTVPLGMIYGWGGHPSIPSAPMDVYVWLLFVVLPIVSLGGAWLVVGIGARLLSRRR